MKLGFSGKLSLAGAIMPAAMLLLVLPATINGQDAAVTATESEHINLVVPASNHYGLGSLLGIILVAVGGLMVLGLAAKSLKRSARFRKPYYPPVLFDRLDRDGIVRLQEQITRIGKTSPTLHMYEQQAHDTNLVFDDPVEQTSDADEYIHAAAAVDGGPESY